MGWESGQYPQRLKAAMEQSSQVISAWDGDKLVGLIRGLDDGNMIAFLHYLLVDPDYQNLHIGGQLMERIKKIRTIAVYKNYPVRPGNHSLL